MIRPKVIDAIFNASVYTENNKKYYSMEFDNPIYEEEIAWLKKNLQIEHHKFNNFEHLFIFTKNFKHEQI